MYIVSRKVLYGDCGDAWPNVKTLNLFDMSITVLSLLKSIKSCLIKPSRLFEYIFLNNKTVVGLTK